MPVFRCPGGVSRFVGNGLEEMKGPKKWALFLALCLASCSPRIVEKVRDRYIYRDRWRDSVRVEERHDTTRFEVKVEKPLSLGQKAKIRAFWWLFGALILCVGWIFRKPLLSILKTWLKL